MTKFSHGKNIMCLTCDDRCFSSQVKMSCWDLLFFVVIIILAIILFVIRGYQRNLILPPITHRLLDPLPLRGLYQRRVRIMLPTGGSGLVQDAKIYQTLIPNSYIVQVERNSPDTHPEAEVEADVNLYLESIHGLSLFPAKERWLMINQEYFFPSYIGMVDVLIVKSRYAEELLTAYIKKIGLTTPVVYTGHISFPQEINMDKNWHLLVHFAGGSRQKGTRQLIHLWQKNKGFRHLVPDSRLVITCRNDCLNRIRDKLVDVPCHNDGWFDPETGLTVYPQVSEEELLQLRYQAGAFICPSIVEGYGHYINEGTASAAVVMTTNFPPMNELVPDNPFLIPPSFVLGSWHVMEPLGFLELRLFGKHLPTSEACFPDFDELENILDTYFKMSTEEKKGFGNRNYEHYLQRQEEFRNLLTNFLNKDCL